MDDYFFTPEWYYWVRLGLCFLLPVYGWVQAGVYDWAVAPLFFACLSLILFGDIHRCFENDKVVRELIDDGKG